MKVLFVSSGNSKHGLSPIVQNQGYSISQIGININYFTIHGKGITGYIKNLMKLRREIKNGKYDLVHSHYSLSSYLATMAGASPLVVSLMGSEILTSHLQIIPIRLFIWLFWSRCIVKSLKMKSILNIPSVEIIPNGVDMEIFKPLTREEGLQLTGWAREKKHILFAANPDFKIKNYNLALKSVKLLSRNAIELHSLGFIAKTQLPFVYAASDVIILTSISEGSPNVIKEAMACCRPIVSTDVGDVKDVFGETEGCFIANFEPNDFANKINAALAFNGPTTGRIRIIELGLDSNTISQRIIKLYNEIVERK